ncbi:MAG: hypothetical protein FWD71_05055 [Oscillospiraceae bacterium]|nr:hypothetical protein [Oscillospiraceae bacterium]
MFKANLLYSDEEYVYKKPKIIGDNVFDDLKVTKIFEFCAPLNFDSISSKDIKYTIEILKNPCQLKKDILYRQEIFRKFLSKESKESGNLVNNLYNALKEVNVLQKIRETYDFNYGGEHDIEYLKAVNYIFFIKSYKLYVDNIYSAINSSVVKFDEDETPENSGLRNFFSQIELEKNMLDSSEITEPVDKFLSYLKDKKNITGELKTQNGVFTTLNFDTDAKNIKSTYPQKIPLFDLIRNVEDYLGIYRQEYEIKEKGKSFQNDNDELYTPEKYTNFEKHFILQLIYDEETQNETSFAPLIKKIIEIHDNIDITYFLTVFDEIKFYRTICKIINIMSENTENSVCYPDVYEDDILRAKLNFTEVFDPIVAVQKLAEYQEKHNTSNLPDRKISDVIPNDVSFDQKNVFVITGPNNGGKTAFVRAVGISLIFFGAGAPVFSKTASFTVGLNIHSHFTANETHLQESGRLQDEINRLNAIIEKSDNLSFIILNETFAGTNSIKALSLFEDFLREMEKINFMCIYVTHFHNIAFYVEDQQDNPQRLPVYSKCDNLIAYMDDMPNSANAGRTYRILSMKPSDTSYSKDIVTKHNLSWEQLKANLKIAGNR